MTNREFYLQRREAEFPVFMSVLNALPPDQLSYRPHERSPSAEQIVWTLARELKACIGAAKDGKAEMEISHRHRSLRCWQCTNVGQNS